MISAAIIPQTNTSWIHNHIAEMQWSAILLITFGVSMLLFFQFERAARFNTKRSDHKESIKVRLVEFYG